jgi:asparagine synthase (glutamine-hydrolysing)
MCGIAGILSAPSAGAETGRAPLEGMIAALRHRGPDGEGIEIISDHAPHAPVMMFAHTRLAIQDLSAAGRQPMCDPATGNWIVFNGEIYNFKDLRAELDGEPWRSRSDTEVILRAYRRWGEDCVERFRGMFAFALWDAGAQRLLLARDPFGIKPLYYNVDGGRLVFASEVRALLASGLVDRRLDHRAVRSYLRFGSVESPLTIVENVAALPAGQILQARVDGGDLHWAMQPFVNALTKEPSLLATPTASPADRMRGILEDSVRAHLISDVPVGAFLSGGIDSSAIVALMSQMAAAPPRTFSVVFGEREYSEGAFARAVAERYATQHTEIPLSESQLLGMLPEALRAMDQPTMDGINTYVVSRAVREAGLKVALSGLGGDELFGGYPSFSRVQRTRWLGRVPSCARRSAARMTGALAGAWPRAAKAAELLRYTDPRDVYLLSRRLFDDAAIKGLLTGANGVGRLPVQLPETPPGSDPFHVISRYELGHYMANTLLRDTDCMSMAHALEVRVPFIDRDVVATALAIPSAHKWDAKRPKPLLLDALGDRLPVEVWSRPKMGFTLPFDRWMRGALRAEIETIVADQTQSATVGLRPSAVVAVWQQFLQRPRLTGWTRPWALYVLAKWCALHGVRA